MTDKQIYDLWLSSTSDLRYLRPRRWKEIKEVLIDKKVTSVLEFGAGVSTLLFSNMNLEVLSLETSKLFIDFVKLLCKKEVTFRHWNNEEVRIDKTYDFSLVDGILPRTNQIKLAFAYSKIAAIDDFNEGPKVIIPPNFKRIDPRTTTLAIFEADE